MTWSYENGQTPSTYRCSDCSAMGCKLWREYNTVLTAQTFRCGRCVLKAAGLSDVTISEQGRVYSDAHGTWTDQVGGMIPAVPTEDGSTYWGYTSVPDDGVLWWRQLPLKPPEPPRSRYERILDDDYPLG